MATVTGFTAERMLIIENSTVVDGEVVGNNLILYTRDGTPIDAGNVRGPIGPAGPQVVDGDKGDITVSSAGLNWQLNPKSVANSDLADMAASRIKGAISSGSPADLTPAQTVSLLQIPASVNDQVGIIYAPRVFANKSGLLTWTPPDGASAVTLSPAPYPSQWIRNAGAWYEIFKTDGNNVGFMTDAFGNCTIRLPANTRSRGATAVGSMIPYPMWCIRNLTDGPIGGAVVVFIVRNSAGQVNANAYCELSYICEYILNA